MLTHGQGGRPQTGLASYLACKNQELATMLIHHGGFIVMVASYVFDVKKPLANHGRRLRFLFQLSFPNSSLEAQRASENLCHFLHQATSLNASTETGNLACISTLSHFLHQDIRFLLA